MGSAGLQGSPSRNGAPTPQWRSLAGHLARPPISPLLPESRWRRYRARRMGRRHQKCRFGLQSHIFIYFSQQHYRPSTMKDRTSTAGVEPVFPGPWDQYNFSPASRTQYPIRIHRTTGIVENEANLLDFKSTIIHALKQSDEVKYSELYSSITVDFGKEVCGPVTLRSGRTSTDQTVALAYAESSQWVGFDSDDSSSLRPSVSDGHFEFQMGPNETYTVPMEKQRGGYRYLTIFTKTPGAILEIKEVSAYFTSMPHWQNLKHTHRISSPTMSFSTASGMHPHTPINCRHFQKINLDGVSLVLVG